jgi:hypothetical protein
MVIDTVMLLGGWITYNYEFRSSVETRSYHDMTTNGYSRVLNRGTGRIAVKLHHEIKQVISSPASSTVSWPITVIHHYPLNHIEGRE